MMWYLGFLKRDTKNVVVFRTTIKPKRDEYNYFLKVMGPYVTEQEAKNDLGSLRRYGIRENPVKKVRLKNPGIDYHMQKFLSYTEQLKNFAVGSRKYIELASKAHEHMKSIKASR